MPLLPTFAFPKTICKLSRLVGWILNKFIIEEEIEGMKQESHAIMALLQMQMPISFFDSQEHLLVHLVEDIALVGSLPRKEKKRKREFEPIGPPSFKSLLGTRKGLLVEDIALVGSLPILL